ncbi:MAG: CvpA family protein [Chloroflexi bacterium]|jgi:membrane protein required for colicin V production|nr:CvpA family protein [Chloroflexota bacterium]
MNWLDIVILVILTVFTFLGLKRGLIQAVVPLFGLILAIFLAGRLQDSLADSLGFIDNQSVANIMAFALILGVVFVVVCVIAMVIQKAVSITFLGWLDRQGGATLGFIVGWLICSMIIAGVKS